MNIKRIRLVNEFLTEQMNHWMFFPLVLTFMGIVRKLTGIGDPGLPLWAACSLIPLLFFGFRKKISRLIPFALLHAAVTAAVIFLPLPRFTDRIVVSACAVCHMLYSFVLRLKNDSVYSDGMQLAVGIGTAAVSVLLQHYQGTEEWDNYYVLALIVSIALYFIIYYTEHYLNFLAVNESSAGYLPAREMFRSGMGLVLGYTLAGAGVLLISSQVAWLAGLLEPVKRILIGILRFLLSGHEGEAEIPVQEEPQPAGGGGGMPLPEPGEPFWLWKVLEYIAMAAFFCALLAGALFLLWKLISLIRKHMTLVFSEKGKRQEEETFDVREKCEIEKGTGRKKQSIFLALAPAERIRKLYKKKLTASRAGLPEEERNSLELHTAREWEEKLKTDGMAAIYEQARYSGREMTGADVKKMKEACR